jgi:DNA-directed RNA polymerase subunit beta'
MTTPAPPPRPTQPWLSISLASPLDIRSWSYGSVETSRIFNRTSQRFHDRGLYSEVIFGPIRDCQCACGKLEGLEHFAAVCGDCNVSVRPRIVRSQRMGHIELPVPVLHPWFFGRDRAPLELLLGVSARKLRLLLDRRRFISLAHTAPRMSVATKAGEAAKSDGEEFLAISGGAAVKALLESIDFVALCKLLEDYHDHLKFPGTISDTLAAWFSSSSSSARQILGSERLLSARLEIVRRVAHRGLIPRNAVLEVVPVIPAGFRIPRATRDGRIQVDSVTVRYQRILDACADVRRSLDAITESGSDWPPDELRRPLVRSERRLQREIAVLFAALLRGSVASGAPLDVRKERRRFSKRVEFSGRAPLVPDAALPLHACRVPERQVTEVLANPFGLGAPIPPNWAVNRVATQAAKQPLVFSLRGGPVSPASLLALQPRATADSAIHVHPAVAATAGRTFAELSASIHMPLLDAAVGETDRLSFPTSALRDPVDGDSRLCINADAAVGCFYATWMSDELRKLREALSGRFAGSPIFASLNDVRDAWERGRVALTDLVTIRMAPGHGVVRDMDDNPEALGPPYRLVTTAGRAVVNGLLPAGSPFYDVPFNRLALQDLLGAILLERGHFAATRFTEVAWALGLRIITRSGLSCSLADLALPATWNKRVEELNRNVAKFHRLYDRGVICHNEQLNATADSVYETRKRLIGDQIDAISQLPRLHLLYAIFAGQQAGSSDSFSRLTGIVGTLWPLGGSRAPMPIAGCYSRGVDMRGYFQLAQEGRRALLRTTLLPRAPRRLGRRIMAALADVAITIEDCGAQSGVEIRRDAEDDEGAAFVARLTGRVILHSLYYVGKPGVIVSAGELITRQQAQAIVANNISHARVRSPLECLALDGVCRRCYGADPATGKLIEFHSAVGVKAALAMVPTLRYSSRARQRRAIRSWTIWWWRTPRESCRSATCRLSSATGAGLSFPRAGAWKSTTKTRARCATRFLRKPNCLSRPAPTWCVAKRWLRARGFPGSSSRRRTASCRSNAAGESVRTCS